MIKKLALLLLTDKRSRKGIGYVLIAIFSPLILVIVTILALLSSGAEHNNSAVDLCFSGGDVAPSTPNEYKESIEDMQNMLVALGKKVAEINTQTEENSLDSLRVKAVFYTLFYGVTDITSVDIGSFADCFYFTEERTNEESGEPYIVNIPHSDMLVVYKNIESVFGRTITEEEMVNANEIYLRQKYGAVTEIPPEVPFVGIDGFVEPVANWITAVSSEFGMRHHPMSGEYKLHTGIDLAKPQGTPIHSVLDGVVTQASYDSAYGYYIRIDHGDGFETLYAHCSKLLVKSGEEVRAGDKIALVGTTGLSTGNHLHFEIIINGERVNPRAYLPQK